MQTKTGSENSMREMVSQRIIANNGKSSYLDQEIDFEDRSKIDITDKSAT